MDPFFNLINLNPVSNNYWQRNVPENLPPRLEERKWAAIKQWDFSIFM